MHPRLHPPRPVVPGVRFKGVGLTQASAVVCRWRRRLTRRCSGLATLAAELHFVRPHWEGCRASPPAFFRERRRVPPHEAAVSVERRCTKHGRALPQRPRQSPPRPTSRLNRLASRSLRVSGISIAPCAAVASAPPIVACEAPAPFRPSLWFLGVTSRFCERLLGRPIPNAPKSGAASSGTVLLTSQSS